MAASIRLKATCLGFDARTRAQRRHLRRLLAKQNYLDYPRALDQGWPIATGVIEGACRHLVKDRLDQTGARWGLNGAEAILKLRALRSNGDFDEYWKLHLDRERHGVHEARYADGLACWIPWDEPVPHPRRLRRPSCRVEDVVGLLNEELLAKANENKLIRLERPGAD